LEAIQQAKAGSPEYHLAIAELRCQLQDFVDRGGSLLEIVRTERREVPVVEDRQSRRGGSEALGHFYRFFGDAHPLIGGAVRPEAKRHPEPPQEPCTERAVLRPERLQGFPQKIEESRVGAGNEVGLPQTSRQTEGRPREQLRVAELPTQVRGALE